MSLRLTDAAGKLVSENFYWRGKDAASYQAMNVMPAVAVPVGLTKPQIDGKDNVVKATLQNNSATPALAVKLTLVNAKGERILPALYSDNYVSLLPGETKEIAIRYPKEMADAPAVNVRGWNVSEAAARAR